MLPSFGGCYSVVSPMQPSMVTRRSGYWITMIALVAMVPLVLLSGFAMRRVAVCNESLNRSTACSAPSKARNSQPCEDSDAPNCAVRSERSIATFYSARPPAQSPRSRCSPAYSQPPRQPRSASALFALGHLLFTRASSSCCFLRCVCAVEFVAGPE